VQPTKSEYKKIALFWHRRDLRLDDNAGLFHALKGPLPVLPLFIFDRNILDDLPEKQDARVAFIHEAVGGLHKRLTEMGSTLLVCYGKPEEVWPQLLATYDVGAVYANRDFEPYALQRDAAVQGLLETRGVPFFTHKDHVIFEKNEVLKDDGSPYTVFTPYSRKWLAQLQTRWMKVPGETGEPERVPFYLASYPNEKYFGNFLKTNPSPVPDLADLGFLPSGISFPPPSVARSLIRNYAQTRDFPGMAGTSRLGVHFRFGTISIREKARHARGLSDIYLNELIWRDFYSQILAHFPYVVDAPFKRQYERVPWRTAPDEFQTWCEGKTGYPIVDAGMRELSATGYMHRFAGPCCGSSCDWRSSMKSRPPACSPGRIPGSTCTRPCGWPRTTAPLPPGSPGTVRAIRSRWNGSPTTAARRR